MLSLLPQGLGLPPKEKMLLLVLADPDVMKTKKLQCLPDILFPKGEEEPKR